MRKSEFITVKFVKEHIKNNGDLNTSLKIFAELDKLVRAKLDEAIQKAKDDGRKTVLERDLV